MFINPLSVFRFTESVSPADGEVALPALLEEIGKIFPFPLYATMGLCKETGCAAGAELSLAGAHANARAPAKISKGTYLKAVNGGVDLTNGHFLAFTDEGVVAAVSGAEA